MYRLKLGDVVKFGRISYKIIKLHLPQMKKKLREARKKLFNTP
jgi:hypothetical protein